MTFNASATELSTIKDALNYAPPLNNRFKLIYTYPDGKNGWILHNAYREKEIKNKLFQCKEIKNQNVKLKELALNIKPEVKTYLFKNEKWVIAGYAITFSIGLAVGVILLK